LTENFWAGWIRIRKNYNRGKDRKGALERFVGGGTFGKGTTRDIGARVGKGTL